MKTSSVSHRSVAAALCAFCSTFAMPGVAADVPPTDTASHEFVLFIGLDVTFEQDGVPLRVKHVSGSQAEVVGDGVSRTISVRQFEGVRTNREPVVATTRVQIDHLKSTSGISGARDPMRAALERQAAEASLASFNADRLVRAEARAADASSAAASAAAASARLNTPEAREQARRSAEESARAADNVRDTVRDTGSEPETSDYLDHTSGQPGARAKSFDQLEITFEASSPETITGAYAVLVTVMRLPTAPKDPVMSLAFRALPTLGPKPRRIALTHDGLPSGFELERCEVHLYQGGRELATNLSERRIELSREEALQYLILQYTMNHAGRDLPPRPVVELLPPDFAARLPANQRSRAADVHVRTDGHVENVRLEPAGSSSADAYFEATLRDTCFYPALVKGQPAATDTTVLLADLAP